MKRKNDSTFLIFKADLIQYLISKE